MNLGHQNGWKPKLTWHQKLQTFEPQISTNSMHKTNETVQTWNPRIEKQNQRKKHAEPCRPNSCVKSCRHRIPMGNRISGIQSWQHHGSPVGLLNGPAARRCVGPLKITISKPFWIMSGDVGRPKRLNTKKCVTPNLQKVNPRSSTKPLHTTNETVQAGPAPRRQTKWAQKFMQNSALHAHVWGGFTIPPAEQIFRNIILATRRDHPSGC